MGSQLSVKGTHGKDVLWGLSGALLAETWLSGRFRRLLVTDEDLDGHGSVEATGLLQRVGWMPLLGGCEPYTELVKRLQNVVVNPSAVVEFPYDWRLPVDLNGRLLADRCHQVIAAWRAKVVQEGYGDPEQVRVVIVAHSMGGMVARHAVQRYGASSVVRSILTLGTPHFGAVQAVQMLALGEGLGFHLPVAGDVELPRRLRAAARNLALTCPAAYDLLPRYRCVHKDDAALPLGGITGGDEHLRHLTPADIVSIGGNLNFAIEAADRYRLLMVADAAPVMPLAGTDQPTLQSLKLNAGTCTFFTSLDGNDNDRGNPGGDATVYRRAAAPEGVSAAPLSQRHGALPRSHEAFTFVLDMLRGGHLPPPLGTRPLAVDIPDAAEVGKLFSVRVSEPERFGPANPAGLSVISRNVDTGKRQRWKDRRIVDGILEFRSPPLEVGVHRVAVAGGGYSAVSDIVLIGEPDGGGGY
jgi:pimeloyl-ACP methyl ester carboxylesterase